MSSKNVTFCFDMDGTFVNFYGVKNWLEMLQSYDATPYRIAKPLINLNTFARQLNAVQRKGAKIVVVSWCSKNSTNEYDEEVIQAKKQWLKKHLPSVSWDEIYIVPYGTNKAQVCGVHENDNFFLFDDEQQNRHAWRKEGGFAYSNKSITETLWEYNHSRL